WSPSGCAAAAPARIRQAVIAIVAPRARPVSIMRSIITQAGLRSATERGLQLRGDACMEKLALSDIRNKSILVTGAGRGIGKRLALGLAQAGARVGLLARSQPELD